MPTGHHTERFTRSDPSAALNVVGFGVGILLIVVAIALLTAAVVTSSGAPYPEGAGTFRGNP